LPRQLRASIAGKRAIFDYALRDQPFGESMLTNVDLQAAQSNAPQPRLIVLIVFIKCIV
jgi:hypothetical protein